MNCLEKHFKKSVKNTYPNRHVIISRTANLTKGLNGRGPCQYRDLCARGCPFSGYFSSVSASLPAAKATGNLTLRPFSVVHSIIYDPTKNKATGVRVIDAQSKKTTEYYARIIFLNAGTINTALVLMNSTSSQFPNGLGNTNDVLGRYLMDHNYRGNLEASYDGFQDQYYYGDGQQAFIFPVLEMWEMMCKKILYAALLLLQVVQEEAEMLQMIRWELTYKDQLTEAGPWDMWMTGMGECLPYAENRVTLSKDKKDAWGMPLVEIDCEYKTNELNMLKDILNTGSEMLQKAGFKNIEADDNEQAPGLGIHEMGTARMGKDPATSILNEHNQIWDVKNVFVTDGACMTSGACQNPSLTYMALTARAANFAVDELKKGNIG